MFSQPTLNSPRPATWIFPGFPSPGLEILAYFASLHFCRTPAKLRPIVFPYKMC